jgi:DNA-binding MarR family transcriptional regulator
MASRRTSNPGQLAPEDYRLLAEFRHLLRRFLVFSEEQAAKIGLSAQQHQALLAIKGFGEDAPSVGDLADRLAIRHNSAVGLINRLVSGGYVVRNGDPDDRRRASLALTGKGDRILEKLSTAHRDELRNIAPLLKPLLARFHA